MEEEDCIIEYGLKEGGKKGGRKGRREGRRKERREGCVEGVGKTTWLMMKCVLASGRILHIFEFNEAVVSTDSEVGDLAVLLAMLSDGRFGRGGREARKV